MFRRVATLRVKTRDGHTHSIEVDGEQDAALQDFRDRTGPFVSEWVQIQTTSHATTLVRYDDIIEVTVLHP